MFAVPTHQASAGLSSIALAMAMLPEEFPLALAVFFALGAWRMARVGVLVRRAAVVETLGAATVLCVDKTGTLTENHMRVAWLSDGSHEARLEADAPVPGSLRPVLEAATLASRAHSMDPMDRALQALAGEGLDQAEVGHFPVAPELPAMSVAHRLTDSSLRVATKGAPEAVARLCQLAPAELAAVIETAADAAARGLRALGVALYKPAMIWPLEPEGLTAFARGLDTLIVVEEKTGLIESQTKAILYGLSGAPAVHGKYAPDGSTMFSKTGDLTPERIALEIGRMVEANGDRQLEDSLGRVRKELALLAEIAARKFSNVIALRQTVGKTDELHVAFFVDRRTESGGGGAARGVYRK